jgi:hypothetical protein
LHKTVAELLASASGRELQAWQKFFEVKRVRDEEARRHQDFLGADDNEEIHY